MPAIPRSIRLALAILPLGLAISGCSSLQSNSTSTNLSDNPLLNEAGGRVVQTNVVPETAYDPTPESKSRVELAYGRMLEQAGIPREATPHLEQALKTDPKSLDAALAVAHNYARIGRPEASLRVYTDATKRHRKSGALFNDMGLQLADMGQYDKAIESLKKAISLDRYNSKYHNNLGVVLAASGKIEAAYESFRQGVGPGIAHYNVGFILSRSGRVAESRAHLEKALALLPQLKEANVLLASLPAANQSPIALPEVQTVTHERVEKTPTVTVPMLPAKHTIIPADQPVAKATRPNAAETEIEPLTVGSQPEPEQQVVVPPAQEPKVSEEVVQADQTEAEANETPPVSDSLKALRSSVKQRRRLIFQQR